MSIFSSSFSIFNVMIHPRCGSYLSRILITSVHFYSTFTTSPPTIPLISLLRQCKTLINAKLAHQQIFVHGFTEMFSYAVGAYIECGASAEAVSLLQRIIPSHSTVFWWNALIRRSVRLGLLDDTLGFYCQMQSLGWLPDHYTFPFVLKACGEIPSFRHGASVHAIVCAKGFESNVFICNSIVAMYGRCGALDDARQMFDEVLERRIEDIVSWNSILAAYVQGGKSRTALRIAFQMGNHYSLKLRPDAITLVNILPACASIFAIQHGKQVHGFSVRSGLVDDVFVGNALVSMYAKCSKMNEANKVFERIKKKDVVSWNAMVTGYSQIGSFDSALSLFKMMQEEDIKLDVITWSAVIAGYAQKGHGFEALDVFRQMQLYGLEPNVVTLVSLLSGCASVGALLYGKQTHAYVIKNILNLNWSDKGDDMLVLNGLIDMYAKCKSYRVARNIFDSIAGKDKDVVTWTVMIGGYAQHGEANDALQLFAQIFEQKTSLKPNAFTLSCALMACARLGELRLGRQLHAYALRNENESEVLYVANCLIDMYSKSGDIDAAQAVFDNMKLRNVVSWTSLMTGYGMHGRGEEALHVFDQMRQLGFVVDGITFLVVLYACSHSGLVDQGMNYFHDMVKCFGITPGAEHYACMVDLLGRAGRLNEAMELIKSMSMEPTAVVWVALLSASRIHANIELGEYAASKLIELGAENDGSYTLLSNLYANARRWKDVARIRSLMKHTGIRKRPGCSWIQGKKSTTTFFVGDRSHPESEQIYNLLSDLIKRIKDMGYVPQTSFALHDVDDEEKGDLLFEHSEKLAVAYGILTTAPGQPIRIHKNLRICGDCHSALTYISMIIDHEIILRDSSRFHHFKKGSCSCRSYW
ncbi:hypothetical protein IC582_000247 [Cucumis melo]|uniref:Pentatricopeptide repeat-containing protein At5g16860 n=1 Tax=Cucumis melo TaxID=3656 RepID=A0A1S3C0G3_CUCME|nr:pentatricopeptide repeat-containing protein At5g16860 [Cucumis melo]XP_008455182.2 pentatricopeptide repeat-containing protein At5g16860 [Cucumis melo]XP_008455184.2 pentatricopeptide repeat-containing protein At5g16860 [Cucumis melo]XP_008455185.2 pentatricopeptide repeat-containing protein At5g16860 [Cucumis melo]XP_008455186.2 pentatricopeptide repeat-containing protein At5g16860 [Cucumis melo]XP_008455189.2 pentatricopeptide repeat-containing protein At5g16860 [Cucumis melo]XP_01690176